MGKFLAVLLVACTVLAGGGMYYLQVYGYYQTLPEQTTFQVAAPDGTLQTLAITGFQGIDATSSPLRYRACFTVTGDLPAMADHPAAEPLNAPGWFACFDASVIGADLAAGRARAVTVDSNAVYGFDTVMALYPDNRAYVWPQINACGEAHFDGRPVPAGCPTPPQR